MQLPDFNPVRLRAVDLLFQHATGYVRLVAAIALLVLVVVSALRRLLSTRGRYNAMSVERWIAKATPITGAFENLVAFFTPRVWRKSILDDPNCSVVLKELLVLTVGGSDNRQTLFRQTTAKLLAQIQLAANVAIDHPSRYPQLYQFLTRTALPDGAGGGDSDIWLQFTLRLESPSKNPSVKPSSAVTSRMGEPSGESSASSKEEVGESSAPSEEEVVRAASRARSRIDNVVARKLDALQV
jgi:hypothetical protein